MSPQVAAVVVLFGTIVLGVDIAIAISAAALTGFLLLGADHLVLLAEKFAEGLDSFPFLAIPLFILAGRIMTRGGIARQLTAILLLPLGRMRGGVAVVTLLSTFFLSGVCGSASADTAAIGAVTIPEMQKRRYPMPFAAAVTATAGATGHLLPPSIDLIIVAVVANLSVGALFLAGIIPAMLNLACMLLLTVGLAIWRQLPREQAQRSHWRHIVLRGVPALLMPVLILGGIRAGLFTPTEAAGTAVVYGLIVSVFVYRELQLREVPGLLLEACVASAAVLFVLGMASALAFLFTLQGVPDDIARFISTHASTPLQFLLIVNVVFLAVGMIMDALPALIVLMPILVPLAQHYEIDPVQFSIIVLANVGLSFIHPPAGLCLYISASIARVNVWEVVRAIVPMFLVLLLLVVLIAAVPALSLWLPRSYGLVH